MTLAQILHFGVIAVVALCVLGCALIFLTFLITRRTIRRHGITDHYDLTTQAWSGHIRRQHRRNFS